jgi:hypothetical protein
MILSLVTSENWNQKKSFKKTAYYVKDYQSTLNFVKAEVFF